MLYLAPYLDSSLLATGSAESKLTRSHRMCPAPGLTTTTAEATVPKVKQNVTFCQKVTLVCKPTQWQGKQEQAALCTLGCLPA